MTQQSLARALDLTRTWDRSKSSRRKVSNNELRVDDVEDQEPEELVDDRNHASERTEQIVQEG